MEVDTVDFETALRLLALPRVVGQDADGVDILAQNGRFGPYLKKGTDTRSLATEEQIFDIDLAGALALYAEPKYGARGGSSALKEFEPDPVSGKPIKIKDGRFGVYVTDGTTNATIPRGETIEDIDFARAVQLLADRRARGPAEEAHHSPRAGEEGREEGLMPGQSTPGKATPSNATPGRGLFITFEGGDGSGKSTQQTRLVEWLRGRAAPCSPPGSREAPTSARSSGSSCCTGAARWRPAPRRSSMRPTVRTTLRRRCDPHSSAGRSSYRTATSTHRSRTRALAGCSTRVRCATSRSGPPRDCCPTSRSCSTWMPSPGKPGWPTPAPATTASKPPGDDFHQRVREAYLELAAAEPERFLVLDAIAAGRRARLPRSGTGSAPLL